MQAILALLQLGELPDAANILPQVALAAAQLVSEESPRQQLEADPAGLRLVGQKLSSLARDSASSTPPIALGLASVALSMGNASDAQLMAEGSLILTEMSSAPHLASAIIEAGAIPMLVSILRNSPPTVNVAVLARSLADMSQEEYIRATILSSNAIPALCSALNLATDPETKLALALSIATLLRHDVAPVVECAGWECALHILVVAASSVSPALQTFANAASPPMAEALMQAQAAREPSKSAATSSSVPAADQMSSQTSHPTHVMSEDSLDVKPLRGVTKMRAADLD